MAGLVVIIALMAVEFRGLFGYGRINVPDLYTSIPAVPAMDGLQLYFSKWSPLHLGTEIGQSARYAIEGVLTDLGIYGAALQATEIIGFTFVSAVSMMVLVRRRVRNPFVSLIAPTLYLLSSNLFILLFDASVSFVFYSLLPLMAFLTIDICARPNWKRGVILGLVIALDCAFEPFGLLFALPPVIVILASSSLISRSFHEAVRSGLALALSFALAILLNAPYYIGNIEYLTTRGIASAYEANVSVVSTNYSWSNPTAILSFLGGGIYPRYAGFFPPWAEGLLIVAPAFAILALWRIGKTESINLRMPMGLLLALSVLWILLTKEGMTLPIFAAIPYLLVFNYPQIPYLYLGLAVCTLSTLAVDDIAYGAFSPGLEPNDRIPANDSSKSQQRDSRRLATPQRRAVVLGFVAFLLIATAIPNAFFLSTGDFRILDAARSNGFPPQWPAVSPSSFEDISRFLDARGGDQAGRVLILPSPTFQGGDSLPGYTDNLFNQEQFSSSQYTGPFFRVPSSAEYSTTVLDYLVSSRTNLIGIPLGMASVKYVVVDKQLNFTGPPRWLLGSLVGSPDSFLTLLDTQQDLVRIRNDTVLAIYENEDFRPYVQGYQGLAVVRSGAPGAQVNETIHKWGFHRWNWSSPLPPNRIVSIVNESNGYLVIADKGNITIRFNTTSPTASLTSMSNRLNNGGIYLSSEPVPVTGEQYVITYQTGYEGPTSHQGGFVFVAGLDSSMSFLWQTPACCPGPVGTRTGGIILDPLMVSPSTAFIALTVVFPHSFTNGTTTTFQLTNVSLNVIARPPPTEMLAPLLLARLSPSYAPKANAVALWRDLSSPEGVASSGTSSETVYLCVGICPMDTKLPFDQLLLAYDSLTFPSLLYSSQRTLDAASGILLNVSGPVTGNLNLAGFPFQTIYVRARGNGTISLQLGSTTLPAASFSGTTLEWRQWALPGPRNDTNIVLFVQGNLQLDALLFAYSTPSLGVPPPATNGTVRTSSAHPTLYEGTLPSGINVLVLSQGFNSAWSLEIGTQKVAPTPALGWANLFMVPPSHRTEGFALRFKDQPAHLILISVEFISFLAAMTYVVLPVARSLFGSVIQPRRRQRDGG